MRKKIKLLLPSLFLIRVSIYAQISEPYLLKYNIQTIKAEYLQIKAALQIENKTENIYKLEQKNGLDRILFCKDFKNHRITYAATNKLQNDELRNTFENWKGNLEQVDDVCLIRIRI